MQIVTRFASARNESKTNHEQICLHLRGDDDQGHYEFRWSLTPKWKMIYDRLKVSSSLHQPVVKCKSTLQIRFKKNTIAVQNDNWLYLSSAFVRMMVVLTHERSGSIQTAKLSKAKSKGFKALRDSRGPRKDKTVGRAKKSIVGRSSSRYVDVIVRWLNKVVWDCRIGENLVD